MLDVLDKDSDWDWDDDLFSELNARLVLSKTINKYSILLCAGNIIATWVQPERSLLSFYY